ncbi:methyltransferase domain-containing protein [Kaistia dalseonensis]|uniref:Glycosyltransferase involved in cell wall biosynthesis/SAM-dependent methyltransferase n=1 Tax=Kaistia dalseonensis TaxID=410840 RepID=A0ABU0H2X7_9HYPH|nr:rhamnan synthesis F family protein [Kaistia dalseonensis]MCX5493264.1 methyltransferase domain-containing protein [Kaistia dalseonensis]MDQ0435821.1 glycosyltransferase involved in cell wall biosynthesis/SAM-dependent methyltransferase [Kaistia dalseonensis]
MNRSTFKFPHPEQVMPFDGERYTSGIEGTIQREHYHRYLFALRYCADFNVLDVASGEGYGSFLLGQVARSVIGVDIDQKTVDFANKNYISERVSYRRGDATKLPIDDHSVDVVVSFETIEHFAGQSEFIAEIDRVLRPGGIVIMSSPNREIYSDAQDYQNPFHVHELNRQEFVDLLSTRFPHVRLFEQAAVIGSVILPPPGEQAGGVEGYTTRDGQLFERVAGVPQAPYFLALAARVPIPPASPSVLHADFYREQIDRRLAEAEQSRQNMAIIEASLRADLAEAEQSRQNMAIIEASLRANLAEEQATATRIRAELAAAQDTLTQTRAKLDVEQATIARLHAQHALALADLDSDLRTEFQEQSLRLFTRMQSAAGAKLPRELDGISRLIIKRKRRLARTYRLILSSHLFDAEWYLATYPDVAALQLDPILHYLGLGAAEARNPGPIFDTKQYLLANPDVAASTMNPLFHFLRHGLSEGRRLRSAGPHVDAAFVRPFYAAAGQIGNPIRIWRKLSENGAAPPATIAEAKQMAAEVRVSPYFDADFYGRRLPSDMDAALHYVIVGENLGWAPSDSFDPKFYFERYPDLKVAKVTPLLHFQNYGRAEGRRGVQSTRRLSFAPLQDERQPILVICHEASRTGAPILGWNLVRDLRKKHPVITLLMRGGALQDDFAAESDLVVGPLTEEEWHPAEFAFLAERIAQAYKPLYAVANSIVTSPLVPPFAALGVPSVALVHEFASYTRPLSWMRPALDWAAHIVFPAHVVAKSAYENFPGFEMRRGVHVLAQGRQLVPDGTSEAEGEAEPDIGEVMRSADEADTFIVLGAGYVHIRKGVDLFLSVAAAARRHAPGVRFKFIWVGDGYKPDEDASYSVYLREQINKSGLDDSVVFLDHVSEFEPAYRTADVFFMSSRLDPQPNVGIDAITLGLPTICFEGASGTGEVLASDPETRALVVPHLDVEAAAQAICQLATDPALLQTMRRAVQRVGRSAFNGEVYATKIDTWGREAAAALSAADLETLLKSGAVEPELALPRRAALPLPESASVEQIVLVQSTVVGLSPDQHRNAYFRRAIPGFHPQAYAVDHIEDCGPGGQDPTAHWIRQGRPKGSWLHPVFSPDNKPAKVTQPLRVALHAHFHYTDHAGELALRLNGNGTPCDLFISTDTEAKAQYLQRAFSEHDGAVTIRVMPNLGRDIGPMLTGFREEIASGAYDLWGHVHGKKSASTASADADLGDIWRTFAWDNLIGREFPMLDVAASAFAANPDLGLAFAEDPHLVGWDGNRRNAEALAERMGLSSEFPEFFDFPLGTMFWFRPEALRPLFDLDLAWEDYPKEPVPYDGSLLHAIERIVPFVTASQSYSIAGLRAPGSTW